MSKPKPSKNWGVRDTSGFFGPDPFLAATEAEARDIAGDDAFAVIVCRESERAAWVSALPAATTKGTT